MANWWMVAVVLGLLISVFGSLILIHWDIRKMTQQLQGIIENSGTNEVVTTSTHNKNLSRFAATINRLTSVFKQEQQRSQKREMELKREITNISHDLRTPLTSIKGFSDLLASPSVSEKEKKEYLAIVQKKIDHLVETVDMFFELSQLESMDQQLVLERNSLDQIVIDTMLTYHGAFEERQLDVQMGDLTSASVLTDRKAAYRIISNIVQNALTYSRSYVIINLLEEEETVRLRVTNDVEAFNTENLEHIFNRTFRIDQSRSGINRGLGLHIVRKLAEKQAGTAIADVIGNEFILEVSFRK